MMAGRYTISVARGDVELAIAPLATIVNAPGVDPVAIFPSEIGGDIDMSICVCNAARDRTRSMRLVGFLSDPSIDSYLASKGVVRFRLG